MKSFVSVGLEMKGAWMSMLFRPRIMTLWA